MYVYIYIYTHLYTIVQLFCQRCFNMFRVHRRYINVPNVYFNVHKVSSLDSQIICPSRCLSRYTCPKVSLKVYCQTALEVYI